MIGIESTFGESTYISYVIDSPKIEPSLMTHKLWIISYDSIMTHFLGRNHADIPFIDDSPSPIQKVPEHSSSNPSTVTLRTKNERKRNIREHRNSYIR